ncbi:MULTISPECIES: hypothetical protein [Klebsiella pneumoniae complex]|nr:MULTISPECIES: hypothetical protein [Klebsiella]MBM7151988.1 hypothetical protein [Klebsiella variicola]HCA6527073.1 hypothetical protein [Klebsiella pneumoniae]HDD9988649.1 hypothetical protein [Klebsiella pneumoniae]
MSYLNPFKTARCMKGWNEPVARDYQSTTETIAKTVDCASDELPVKQ